MNAELNWLEFVGAICIVVFSVFVVCGLLYFMIAAFNWIKNAMKDLYTFGDKLSYIYDYCGHKQPLIDGLIREDNKIIKHIEYQIQAQCDRLSEYLKYMEQLARGHTTLLEASIRRLEEQIKAKGDKK